MKSEFLIERQGRQFVLFAGLLDEAHRQGLKRITTTLIQVPTPDNGQVAICAAEVETERGVFCGIGDASPQNVARAMQTALIRMAETRSKARALRDAVNVSAVSLEELSEEETGPAAAPAAPVNRREPPAPSPGPQAAPARAAAAPSPESTTRGAARPGITAERPAYKGPDPATPAQRRMIEGLARTAGVTVQADTLTRTEAAAKITELKAKTG